MICTLELAHKHGGIYLHTFCLDVLSGPLELLQGEARRRFSVQSEADPMMNAARLLHPEHGEVWSIQRVAVYQ